MLSKQIHNKRSSIWRVYSWTWWKLVRIVIQTCLFWSKLFLYSMVSLNSSGSKWYNGLVSFSKTELKKVIYYRCHQVYKLSLTYRGKWWIYYLPTCFPDYFVLFLFIEETFHVLVQYCLTKNIPQNYHFFYSCFLSFHLP